MGKSLKLKIMILMLIIIIIPLLAVGIISTSKVTSSTEQIVEDKLDELTKLTAEAINAELTQAHLVSKLISANTMLQSLASGDFKYRKEANKYLQNLQEENDNILEMLVVTDAKGKGITSSTSEFIDVDVSDRAYFKDVLENGSGQSGVVISKISEKPVVAIAYPLIKNGDTVGVVIASVKFENIAEHVSEIKVFDSGYAYMFDKSGLVLSHPTKENEFNLNFLDVGIPELNTVIEDVNQQKSGHVLYTYKGVYKFVAYAPVGEWGIAVTANYDDYMKTTKSISQIIIIAGVFAALLALLVAYWFTTVNIIKPLSVISQKMAVVGKGDLTASVDIKTGDEIEFIGKSFNEMVLTQHEVVQKVKVNSGELAISSDDISNSANNLSASTEDIAKNIMDVAKNIEVQTNSILDTSQVLVQLSSLIQLAKASAEKAVDSASASLEVVGQGRTSVDETVKAMTIISSSTDKTAQILEEIETLSSRVMGVIDTINGISEQTNLLALNASIEAARAGEHGRGFAVVAEEVRKLAEQTGDEANSINGVVRKMVDSIKQAVSSMNDGNAAVKDGVEKSMGTDKAFLGIQEAIDKISKDISKIVEVTTDEVSSSDRILELIDHVATLSEKNAGNSQSISAATEEQTALSETLAAGSEELNAMANELHHLTDQFKVRGE